MRAPSMKTIEDIKLQGLNVSNPIDANIFKKNKAINNQIYVFMSKTLNTILGCSLGKLGDSINPEKRVFKEWYPELQEVFDDIELILTLPAVWWDKENPWIVHMVRDYAFHTYLREKLYVRMVDYFSPEYLNQVFKGAKISQEFYIFDYFSREEIIEIVKEAMEDIKKDITNPASPYKYYSYKISETNKELIFNSEKVRFKRDKDFGLRDFQKDIAHKNARYAIQHRHKGLNNYTMIVAPTRAGKTHTALTELKILLQEAQLEESLTLVITGIVPALYEWVESCESHVSFKDLYIYTMKELRDNPNLIKEARDRGEKHIIVAASLQDLAGSNRNKGVKYNHKFLEEEKLTKIFVDEAHYAMLNCSPEYSKILHNDEYSDFEDLTGLNKKNSKKFAKNIGTLKPEYGVSYITATPYDALYSGLFDFNENNTSIITAQDIQEEHKKWCRENPDKPENQSPYFGIPQPYSHRVPFSMPWEQLLETTPDGDLIHYDYIKKMFSDLFGVTIQGYSANIFNNKLFKENRLGNGIIITVDRQKIADQLEDILNEVLKEKNYSILNISSHRGNKYSDMPTNRIQQVIENITSKFIVITVNRMMTGSTIRKVDTVLFARHISSASALIQYLGRAGSPYVVEVESDEIDPTTGNKKTEKVCMKPYCAALFLDPTAALTVHDQQLKFIVDHKDYSDSEEGAYRAATQELLETNPIIDYDEVTGQLREMTVNDIMSLTIEHSKYLTDPFRSRIKGVNAFNIKNIDSDSIVKLNNLVFKSAGIQDLIVNYFDEEKYDSDSPEGVCKIKDCGLAEFKDFLCVKHYKDLDSKVKETIDRVEKDTVSKKNSADNHMIELLDRMDDLTVQCMIYVVLHPDTIRSMREVVKSARDTVGARIVKNIGLDIELLEHFIDHNVFKPSVDMLLEQQELIYSEMDGDSKIVDIMKSLKSLSVNEIISSDAAVKLLNDKIDFSVLSDSPAFLDNGCKSGVILIDIARRLKESGYSDSIIRNALWCIPTSGLTYEIIRLVYESYGWNTDHILWTGGKYSALEVNDFLVRYQHDKIDKNSDKDMFMLGLFDEVLKELADKNNSVNDVDIDNDADNDDNNVNNKLFTYTVSNPPYQDSSNRNSIQIYDKFWLYAAECSSLSIMIFPIGWQNSSGRGTGSAKHPLMRSDKRIKIVDNYYEDQKESNIILFPTVSTGGVNIVLLDNDYDNNGKVKYYEYGVYKKEKDLTDQRFWSEHTDNIFNKIDSYIKDNGIKTIRDIMPGRTPYGVRTFMVKKDRPESKYFSDIDNNDSYKCWANINNNYSWVYLDKNAPFIKDYHIDKYKAVFPITGAYRCWRSSFTMKPNEIFTDTFICITFKTLKEAQNYNKYLSTLFYRFLLTESTNSHNANKNTHRHCPDLTTITNPRTGLTGWDSDWTDEDLQELLKDYLTEEDWVYIKETALKSDNGRQ